MKLNDVLHYLDTAKFLHSISKIHIVVTKGKSLKKDDQIFDCYLPVPAAMRFFGELEVVINKLETYSEYNIPTFMFLISYGDG